jgi:hypothetical protein
MDALRATVDVNPVVVECNVVRSLDIGTANAQRAGAPTASVHFKHLSGRDKLIDRLDPHPSLPPDC